MSCNTFLPILKSQFLDSDLLTAKLKCRFVAGELWEGAPSGGLGELGIGKKKLYDKSKRNPQAT